MPVSPALALYLAASRLAGPLAPSILARRLARGKEDATRLGERLGRAGLARPAGRLAWLHAASVGEALSLLPLVAALRKADPALRILVTTGTVTSAARMARDLPSGVIHQFVPLDTARAVRGFLDHWRPDLAIWVESEFWPRLMVETAARGTPMMLVNARVSARSAARWRWLPGMAARLLRLFARIATQDEATRERLVGLGADPARVSVGGNLKVLIETPAADAATLAAFREALAGRPVWLAASTHDPEEEAVIAAQREIGRVRPGALAILAPRHPDRAGEIAAMAERAGLGVARRAAGEMPAAGTDLYLADTLGEMGLWFRLAPVAFVGGSLADKGGHNPFEPAALGAAILHGPDTSNFAPAYAALHEAGAALRVADAESLAREVARLLGDERARTGLADAARAVLESMRPDVDALAAEALGLMAAEHPADHAEPDHARA